MQALEPIRLNFKSRGLFQADRIRESCFQPYSGHIDVYAQFESFNRILKPNRIQKTSFLSFRSPCLGAILIISRVRYVISDFWNQYINRLNFSKALTVQRIPCTSRQVGCTYRASSARLGLLPCTYRLPSARSGLLS